MTKPGLLSAGLALALTLSIAPAAMAQDDDLLGEDPTVTAVFDAVDPADITEADLDELSILSVTGVTVPLGGSRYRAVASGALPRHDPQTGVMGYP